MCELRQAAAAQAEPIAESRPNCYQCQQPILFLPHPHMSTTDDISMKLMLAFPRKDLNVDLEEVALVSEQASGNRIHLPSLHSSSCLKKKRTRNHLC